LSNEFIRFSWSRQVVSNQYGKGERAARNWAWIRLKVIREEELVRNKKDQNLDNVNYQFRDYLYYASKEYNIEDIQVPLLSFANWGGILSPLRSDIEGHVRTCRVEIKVLVLLYWLTRSAILLPQRNRGTKKLLGCVS